MKSLSACLACLGIFIFFYSLGWALDYPRPPLNITPQVIGSGGTRVADSTNSLTGTIGQPLIGVIGILDTIDVHGEVGFWYQLGYVLRTSIGSEENQHPKAYRLDQNFPNPFNPSTTIRFTLPKDSHVSLKVYDVLGRLVATLVDKQMNAGVHSVTFKNQNLSSGVYFYRIQAGGFVQAKKLIMLK